MADSLKRALASGIMLLVLDNYDSFTYNLVQYAGELGADPVVYRNDALSVDEALALQPAAIVISPGPCTPREAGISVPLVRAAAGGRRAAARASAWATRPSARRSAAEVVRADRLMHGKTTMVAHTGHPLFAGLPSPFEAMRYHSLVVAPGGLPDELEVTAWSADRPAGSEIMALCHRELPIYGVQFHPESVGTDQGKRILRELPAACTRAADGGPSERPDHRRKPFATLTIAIAHRLAAAPARLLTRPPPAITFRDARPGCHSGSSWLDPSPQQTAPAAGR